jgi:hypothetical protein
MRTVHALLLAACCCLLPAFVRGALVADFDGGVLPEGWLNLSPGPDRNPNWAVVSVLEGVPAGPQAGTHALFSGVATGGEYRDSPHDLLLVRSVPFFLDGSGPLTLYAIAGAAGYNGYSYAPTLGTDPIAFGTLGVALRSPSTGERVLAMRTTNQNANVWTLFQFSEADLAPYVGRQFTLDIIDYYYGGWGAFGVDTIVIPGVLPEPASAATATLLAVALLARRRAR